MVARHINDAGLRIIEEHERPPAMSIHSDGSMHPYPDPVQVWTIGWGHAISSQGRHLQGQADRGAAEAAYPDGLTPDQAGALLRQDALAAVAAVQQLVTVPLGDNEFSALVSFTFNVGGGNLASSTLLRNLNAGDRFGAIDQFGRWVLARGVQMPGLVERRRKERDLFITPDA